MKPYSNHEEINLDFALNVRSEATIITFSVMLILRF